MVEKVSVISLVFLLLMTPNFSEEPQAQVVSKGIINPQSLKERSREIVILDVRSEKEYEKAHIHSAVVIPLKEISESRLSALGFQKTHEIVVYANSDTPSKKAKLLLNAMGFTRVKILGGGLAHWKEDGFLTVPGKMYATPDDKGTDPVSSIHIQPKEYDFGIITAAGGIVETTFSLVNRGDKIVRIEDVSTTCGCTSATISKKAILPGEDVSLKVSFDPNFHKEPEGRLSRTVLLQTSEGIELQTKIYVEIALKDET